MKKLFAAIIATTFAFASFGAIAAKHGDGMKKEDAKMEKKAADKDGKATKSKKKAAKKDKS